MVTSHKTDIVIAGGGIAGLLTALRLGQAGIPVILIENSSLEPSDPAALSARTAALMPHAIGFLETLGIWPDLESATCPLETIQIMDGDVTATFEASDIKQPWFSRNVPNDLLRHLLLKELKNIDCITLLDGNGLWDFEEQESDLLIRLNDDTSLRTKLLIGADGKNSLVRKIAGIKEIKTGYGQSAMTCLINHSLAHNNTSFEFHKPGGPFTLVPCPGNRSAVVWCEKRAEADKLIALKKGDFTQALQDQTHNILGEITLESPPHCWPLKGILARKIVAHRLVLIAEAAHTLHPIGAQGLNLSIRDIDVLTALIIKQHELGLDVGALDMLKTYKSRRRHDTYTHYFGISGLCALTSGKSTGVKRLRQVALGMLNRSAFLRRQAMKLGFQG